MGFVARVLAQIPDGRRHLARYYGFYSNAARGKRKKVAAPAEPSCPSEAPEGAAIPDGPHRAAIRRRWAEMIRRVYEVESARRSLARLRTPRSRSPAPCEICPLPPVEAKREAGGVGSRPMGTPPQGVRRSPLPPGHAPEGRPAVETPPRRPREPPGGSPRHTPHWKAEAEKQSPVILRGLGSTASSGARERSLG